jgi:RecB family endonuclease NucS
MKKHTGTESHLFISNVECHKRYLELLRDERVWRAQGQYLLAQQSELLAKRLLHGDESIVTKIVVTEGYFMKTKKFTFGY